MLRPILLLTLLVASMAACSSSRASSEAESTQSSVSPSGLVTRDIKVGQFTGIDASMAISIDYTCVSTGKPRVTLRAPEEVIDLLAIEVKGNDLHLGFKSGRTPSFINSGNGGIRVTIEGPALSRIDLSTAASMNIKGDMHAGDKLLVDLGSASQLSVTGTLSADNQLFINAAAASTFRGTDLKADRISVDASSASTIKFANLQATSNSYLEASGAARVAGGTVKCNALSIESSSTSRCELTTIDCSKLSVETSSSGVALVGGKCTSAILEASSASRVDAASLSADKVSAEASSGGLIDAPSSNSLYLEESTSGKVRYKNVGHVVKSNSDNDDDD